MSVEGLHLPVADGQRHWRIVCDTERSRRDTLTPQLARENVSCTRTRFFAYNSAMWLSMSVRKGQVETIRQKLNKASNGRLPMSLFAGPSSTRHGDSL